VARPAAVAVANLEVEYESLDDADAEGLQIIDIREASELVDMPTPSGNARHIPMAELLHGNTKLAPSGKYLLVCASGRRSYAAAEELRSRGFAEVYSLRGGVSGLARRSVI
jgi:adenylyltransferase/sulfurtransferase